MIAARAGGTFPLPHIAPPYSTRSRSRRLRQRANRAFVITDLTNSAIDALNWLSSPSCTYPPPPPPPLPSLPSVHTLSRTKLSSISNLYKSCQRFVSRLSVPSSDDTMHSDILPVYLQNQHIVPLDAEKIALPVKAGTVQLLDLLPNELSRRYSNGNDGLLKTTPQSASPCTFLHGDRVQYIKLLRRMAAAGMLSFTTQPIVVNGLFAVSKPDGQQRLIIDARPANNLFLDPPPVSLPTPDLLSNLEVPSGSPIFIAKCDLENFYHRLRLPPWLWPYFALPPVKADELGLDQFGEGVTVWPCCTTLPMGWNHAVFVAQSVHENVLNSLPGLEMENRIAAGMDSRLDRVRHAVYIDDLILLGMDPNDVKSIQRSYISRMSAKELEPKHSKTVEPTATCVECLGLELDGISHTFGLSPQKLQRLIALTRAMVDTGRTTGERLSQLLGKWSWACLACRPAFAVFNSVYRFIAIAGAREFEIWPSVRAELLCIADLAPLLLTTLTDNWFDSAIATDASSLGMGVVVTKYGKFSTDIDVDELVSQARWSTIISSRWNFSEHINILECRAVETAVRWLVSRPASVNSKVLVLSDSLVIIGAISKGRSSSFQILTRLRSLSASILAGGFRLFLKWISTSVNPADEPSRW